MPDKPKRLILGHIPINVCNLQCPYCYFTQRDIWNDTRSLPLAYPPDDIARCLSAERLGGVSLINLTGQGETLLQPGIEDLVRALLLKGHYVEIVTNGTVTKVINRLLAMDAALLARLEFKISFHYNELKRHQILDQFWRNVDAIKASPCSFSLELMPCDEQEAQLDEIMGLCRSNAGAACHATVGRNDGYKGRYLLTAHSREQYVAAWSKLGSAMFDFKMALLDVKRKEFCYAGSWTLWVNMSTGDACQCYGQPVNQNIFKDPAKPIKFIPVGYYCTEPYCVNGHALLTMGAIPEIAAPTYADIRNKACDNGGEWFSETCRSFFQQRLMMSNKQLTRGGKTLNTMTRPFLLVWWLLRRPEKALNKLRRYLRLDGKSRYEKRKTPARSTKTVQKCDGR
ncbi:radical SAM protein [Oscillospiraceae bacterium WX1]